MAPSQNMRPMSLSQRLSQQEPARRPIKPSLSSRLRTLTCLRNGPEDLKEPQMSMNRIPRTTRKIEKVSLLERLNVSENQVSSVMNLHGNVPSSTSTVLIEPNGQVQQVSSPQISCELMMSCSTGRKTPKKSNDVSCITVAARNSTKLDGLKSSLKSVSTLAPSIQSSLPRAPLINVQKPSGTWKSSTQGPRKQQQRRS